MQGDVTQLLLNLESGKREAFDQLVMMVYPDLRKIAHARLRHYPRDRTLNTTGLVHEAYLRLVPYDRVSWKGRAHFFGAAAQTMRRILIDLARSRTAQKRSGERVRLTGELLQDDVSLDSLLEIDDALSRLEAERPRWVRVVECRYFAGLSIVDTAEVLGISHGTVSNDWRMARAWLKRELG